jgi:hypothetical protein
MQGRSDDTSVNASSLLPLKSSVKVIPIDARDINVMTPLVHRAARSPTKAAMTRWFKAMKEAGIPQVWVHYPDGTKLEFRATAQEAEVNTWADVA